MQFGGNADIPPVRLTSVGKRYGGAGGDVAALADIDVTVAAGEMIALVGPSGCGKSTLLNIIGCIDLPTSGRAEIAGRATTDLDDDALTLLRRVHVGTVFQSFHLLGGLTLAENIGLPLVLQSAPQERVARETAAALERVGLTARANARPSEVSGGQQQRAALMRAIIHKPAILLADEPTGNLDSVNGAAVLDLLSAFAAAGQSIVMATHSAEAAARCDRTIFLRDGRIVETRARAS